MIFLDLKVGDDQPIICSQWNETETNELLIAFLQFFGGASPQFMSPELESLKQQKVTSGFSWLSSAAMTRRFFKMSPHPFISELPKNPSAANYGRKHDKISSGWKSVHFAMSTTWNIWKKTWGETRKKNRNKKSSSMNKQIKQQRKQKPFTHNTCRTLKKNPFLFNWASIAGRLP